MIIRFLLQSVFFFLTVAAQAAGGDLVYSYDTITGEVSQKAVTDTFVRESNHLNYLTIVDESGREQIIETTDSHPFWVVTGHPELWRAAQEVVNEDGTLLYHENLGVTEDGYWVEAKDLREGDVFLGANGELSVLTGKERVTFAENIKVYNFTVDGNHDYFVIAQTGEYGQTCVLVHNAEYSFISVYDFQRTHRINKTSAQYRHLKKDIIDNGIQEPIKYIVYQGTKYVVDGHHRLAIARELGIKTVPAREVTLPFGAYRHSDDLFF